MFFLDPRIQHVGSHIAPPPNPQVTTHCLTPPQRAAYDAASSFWLSLARVLRARQPRLPPSATSRFWSAHQRFFRLLGTHFALVLVVGLRPLALISTFSIGFVVFLLATTTPLGHLSLLVCSPAILRYLVCAIRTSHGHRIAATRLSSSFSILVLLFCDFKAIPRLTQTSGLILPGGDSG